MSVIVWLLSALLMLIGSCSQPTVAGYLTPLPSRMMISQSMTIIWADIPADLPVGTLIELVLVMPDGGQQVVGSTDTVMFNRSREAWLTWVTPAFPVASAQIFARGGGYVSPIAAFRVEDVQVRFFTADKTSLQPGESVTLTWSVSGGASVSIYRVVGGFITHGQPLEGSITIAGPGEGAEINSVVYTLLIAAEDGTIYDIMFPPQIEIPLVKP